MSYPNFGKVKTITIPINLGEELTLKQYREKYGIDFNDLAVFTGSIVALKRSNTLFLIYKIDEDGIDIDPALAPLSLVESPTEYEFGVTDLEERLETNENTTWYVRLSLSKDVENPILDDVIIKCIER